VARDRGQAAIMFVVIVVAIATASTAGLVELGMRVRDRTQAQSAADAAALAGLDGGHREANRVAAANGSTLVTWSAVPGTREVTVVVQVRGQIASARASDEP
jgi:Flp pilus assembly protein TadG